MFTDTLTAAPCDRMVGLPDGLRDGFAAGGCVDVVVSPLTVLAAIAVAGLAIACLQALVRALLFGRGGGSSARRHATQNPETGLREATNRARARRIAESVE